MQMYQMKRFNGSEAETRFTGLAEEMHFFKAEQTPGSAQESTSRADGALSFPGSRGRAPPALRRSTASLSPFSFLPFKGQRDSRIQHLQSCSTRFPRNRDRTRKIW